MKAVLQERLKEVILNDIPITTCVTDIDPPVDTIPNADDGWFPGSRWILITPEENTVENNTPNTYYVPTE